MKINNLLLENFQIHKELLLEFSPGVNTLVGESDAGKSAVVRAIDLLLRNQPRGGEPLYQSDFTEKPLNIVLEDDRNNILERSGTYKLNGSSLKAYGSTIPEPVLELFPMKDINFQFQLDPYFLILETGGKAAEILNKATGFSDQEMILKELKERTSESKKLLKTLIKQKERSSAEVERLKNVPHFLMKAKAIMNLEEQYKTNNSTINILEENAIDLAHLEEEQAKYVNLDKFKKELEKICEAKSKVDYNLKVLTVIKTKRDRLKFLQEEYKKHEKLKKYSKDIKEILQLVEDSTEIRKGKIELEFKKRELDALDQQWMQHEMVIDDLKLKLDTKLEELGKCPLCGSDLKGKKLCLKHS